MSDGEDSDWVVQVIGPDEVWRHISELSALRHANGLNTMFAAERAIHGKDENLPFSIAIAKSVNAGGGHEF